MNKKQSLMRLLVIDAIVDNWSSGLDEGFLEFMRGSLYAEWNDGGTTMWLHASNGNRDVRMTIDVRRNTEGLRQMLTDYATDAQLLGVLDRQLCQRYR